LGNLKQGLFIIVGSPYREYIVDVFSLLVFDSVPVLLSMDYVVLSLAFVDGLQKFVVF
jgi:hypothetical protein